MNFTSARQFISPRHAAVRRQRSFEDEGALEQPQLQDKDEQNLDYSRVQGIVRSDPRTWRGNWDHVAAAEGLERFSPGEVATRWSEVDKPAPIKGPWTREEDALLIRLVQRYGPKKWSQIALHVPGRKGSNAERGSRTILIHPSRRLHGPATRIRYCSRLRVKLAIGGAKSVSCSMAGPKTPSRIGGTH